MAKATPPTEDIFADLRAEDEAKKAMENVQSAFPAVVQVGEMSLFATLAQDAVVSDGHDLLDKDRLVEIPFIITAIVYRDGVMRKAAQNNKLVDVPTNYVSVECVVGDKFSLHALVTRKPRLLDRVKVLEPNERIVINDGSTGICRQVTAYLHQNGAIDLPEGPIDGPAGESRYDTYRADWQGSVVPLVDYDGVPHKSVRFELGGTGVAPAFLIKRGLRVSEYENNGQPAGTYYLA